MKGFVGAAGTGKTFRLMREVESWLSNNSIGEDQHVLALTRMHGSRRRLTERLSSTSAKRRFRCMTLDRFSWLIASRWRSLSPTIRRASANVVDYESTSRAAASALHVETVRIWLRAHYPLILVDELQDCHGEQLELIKALALSGELFVAADEYQDLTASGKSPAVAWLESLNCSEQLTENHRTRMAGLLAGASAIRTGQVLTPGRGLAILQARNANVGASLLANQILWSAGEEIVVLSPTAPDSCRFVQDVFERIQSKPFTKKGHEPVGPYRIGWQGSMKQRVDETCAELNLPASSDAIVLFSEIPSVDTDDGKLLLDWIQRRRKLGKQESSAGELRRVVQNLVQQTAAWQQASRGLWGTSIHGAKNREFEHVAILWPCQVKAGEAASRLLYNALTRAKKNATIIVQDPKDERLHKPPFAATEPEESSPQMTLF